MDHAGRTDHEPSDHDPAAVDDETLRAYLADTLAPGAQARVEKALRDSAELRARLEDVRKALESVSCKRSKVHEAVPFARWILTTSVCASTSNNHL